VPPLSGYMNKQGNYPSTLMTGAGDTCHKSERVYLTTWRHIPGNNNLKKTHWAPSSTEMIY